KVTASINVGVNPDSVVITPNSCYAYVPNNNNYGITNQDSVSVLDLKKKILIKTIHDKSFVEPFRAACSPNGKRVYVANSNGSTLSIIKTKTNKVIGTIDGFDGPSGIVITPDGKFGYVNNYGHPGG